MTLPKIFLPLPLKNIYNYNTNSSDCKDISGKNTDFSGKSTNTRSQVINSLSDSNFYEEASELTNKFATKRIVSQLLSDSFSRLGYSDRALRVSNCGTFLEFRSGVDYNGEIHKPRLTGANFCFDRLCPMCNFRRSRKIFNQVFSIVNHLGTDKYKYLMLTLTVRNCKAEDLSSTIDRLYSGIHNLFKQKRVKKIALGCFRALEITYNEDRKDFHPHFHIIIAVPSSYKAKHPDYISQSEWLSSWRSAYGDDSILILDVRFIDGYDGMDNISSDSLKKAVCEVAKYSVKSSDYLLSNNSSLTDFLVLIFAESLRNRRLCSFTGIFSKARKELNLDDVEDGNLVHIETEEDLTPFAYELIVRYKWHVGLGGYSIASQKVVSVASDSEEYIQSDV